MNWSEWIAVWVLYFLFGFVAIAAGVWFAGPIGGLIALGGYTLAGLVSQCGMGLEGR